MSDKPTTAVKAAESRTKCPTPDEMSDQALVNYVGKQFTKFLLEMRPYLIEVHTRFLTKKAKGRPFLGYTDWDKFCVDFFHYTGRHVRRIINGEGLRKRPKHLAAAEQPAGSKSRLPEASVWTDHDFIHKCSQTIKQVLRPLESDPMRYAKVAAAIAEEITGDPALAKCVDAGAWRDAATDGQEEHVAAKSSLGGV